MCSLELDTLHKLHEPKQDTTGRHLSHEEQLEHLKVRASIDRNAPRNLFGVFHSRLLASYQVFPRRHFAGLTIEHEQPPLIQGVCH